MANGWYWKVNYLIFPLVIAVIFGHHFRALLTDSSPEVITWLILCLGPPIFYMAASTIPFFFFLISRLPPEPEIYVGDLVLLLVRKYHRRIAVVRRIEVVNIGNTRAWFVDVDGKEIEFSRGEIFLHKSNNSMDDLHLD